MKALRRVARKASRLSQRSRENYPLPCSADFRKSQMHQIESHLSTTLPTFLPVLGACCSPLLITGFGGSTCGAASTTGALTTTLIPSVTSATTGMSITFTAAVSPTGATGMITFHDGTTLRLGYSDPRLRQREHCHDISVGENTFDHRILFWQRDLWQGFLAL